METGHALVKGVARPGLVRCGGVYQGSKLKSGFKHDA